MPITKVVENVTDGQGNIIEQVMAEISDEQLYQEQIDRDSNDGIHAIRVAYDNWDNLTSNEQKAMVKQLLACVLNLYQGRY